MTKTSALVAWLKTRITALPGLAVYDGAVPDSVPLYPGTQRIKPYIAIWTTPNREPDETTLDHTQAGRAGDVTLTVAADTAANVREISDAVIAAIHRKPTPGAGEYIHAEPHVPIQIDIQVSPARYYQPLRFRLLTAH
ncbi:DUF3168 domain-containing protein [Brevibacterium sp. p3-SID960]|uniref:DUF3168 domain-containing protein n=1 Tax=Brevibacterium sp. p3-SID960 TaxID=2916063 RepID=UPI0021A53933|nr:DUF3168 domain-containing protein [Brevibacterium sp. p3-SID960]MCT1689867.1 DUF3168 domain-containing protein [Brevibacterium sp. p3-SID960]